MSPICDHVFSAADACWVVGGMSESSIPPVKTESRELRLARRIAACMKDGRHDDAVTIIRNHNLNVRAQAFWDGKLGVNRLAAMITGPSLSKELGTPAYGYIVSMFIAAESVLTGLYDATGAYAPDDPRAKS